MKLHLMKGTHQQNTFLSSYKGHGGDSEYYCSAADEIYKPLQLILYKTLNIKLTSGITFYTKLHFYTVSIFKQN
jgi:hypothetical protein